MKSLKRGLFGFLSIFLLTLLFQTNLTVQQSVPFIKLNNGHEIPGIGFGIVKHATIENMAKTALRQGYTFLESSAYLNNELDIGNAVMSHLTDNSLNREDLFIASKLWNSAHKPGYVEQALKYTLSNLRVDYLDLYIMQWPLSYKFFHYIYEIKGFEDNCPIEVTWQCMEKLVQRNLIKSIGVSNFNLSQIERIMTVAKIKPAIILTEINPYMFPEDIINYCKKNNVTIGASNPLYSPNRPFAKTHSLNMFSEPIITDLAKKYNTSEFAVLIRYPIDLGAVPIIPVHYLTNRNESKNFQPSDAYKFTLTQDEVKNISSLNKNLRTIKLEHCIHYNEYPFVEMRERQFTFHKVRGDTLNEEKVVIY